MLSLTLEEARGMFPGPVSGNYVAWWDDDGEVVKVLARGRVYDELVCLIQLDKESCPGYGQLMIAKIVD